MIIKNYQNKIDVNLDISIYSLSSGWKGNFENLPSNQTFDLIIDYPFGGTRKHIFKIKTGRSGLGLIELLSKIGKAYEKLYENPVANGVFGHDIYDLHLEGINVDLKKKIIKLYVGS